MRIDVTPVKSLRNKRSEKEERKRKQNNINEMRREKRLTIVNTYRGVNDEWTNYYDSDSSDSITNWFNSSVSLVESNIVVMPLNNANIIEMQIKQLMQIDCRNLVNFDVFCTLSSFVTNSSLSVSSQIDIFCLIEKIVEEIHDINEVQGIEDINVDVLIKSGIISSILFNFDHQNIEIATKAIKTMLDILNRNHDSLIKHALSIGFVDVIIKLIHAGNKPKMNHKKKLDILVDTPKANFYQQLAKSVNFVFLSNDFLQSSTISTLLSASLILLGFPDHYNIHADILSGVEFLAQYKAELVFNNFHSELIAKVADLLTNKNEMTVTNAINIFCDGKRFAANINFLATILNKLEMQLNKKRSVRVIKQIIYILGVFIDNSDALKLLIEDHIHVVSFVFNQMKTIDCNLKEQVVGLVWQFISLSNYVQILYLIECDLIESLAYILCLAIDDRNLRNKVLDIYIYLLTETEKCGQLETVKKRMLLFGISKYVNTLITDADIDIANKVRFMNRFLIDDEECSTNIGVYNSLFDYTQTPMLSA